MDSAAGVSRRAVIATQAAAGAGARVAGAARSTR